MRLTPKPLVIGKKDGFTPENDIFKLETFGNNLADIIENIEEPLVIALDGGWGVGKSIFIKQWSGLCRNRGIPVISFDAFENDYQSDAFIALAAAITKYAADELNDSDKSIGEFTNAAKKVGKALLPTFTKIAIKTATLGIISATDLKDISEDVTDALKDTSEKLEDYIEDKIKNSIDEQVSFSEFRLKLENISEKLSEKCGNKDRNPLLLIAIDELDRCTPAFSIDIIEKIKHFYSVKGICFVLVANFEQTEKAIKGRYGSETNARSYLEKFFHLRVSIPESSPDLNQSRRRVYFSYLFSQLGLENKNREMSRNIVDSIGNVLDKLSISLRTVEKIVSICALSFIAAEKNRLRIDPIISGLAIMYVIEPELFKKAQNGTLSWGEVAQFHQISSQIPISNLEGNYYNWWKYATDKNYSDKNIEQYLFQYSIPGDDRGRLIKFLSKYIDIFQLSLSR